MPSPTKMTLSIATIFDLQNALAALDGTTKAVRDGEREIAVRSPYKLGAGLRMAIAKNLYRLKVVTDAYTKAINDTISELSGGGTQLESPAAFTDPDEKAKAKEKWSQFSKEKRELEAEMHEVELITMTEAELKLDDNTIPGTVLMGLCPIVEGWQLPEKPAADNKPKANGHAEASATA
jgi:hypothetical protein